MYFRSKIAYRYIGDRTREWTCAHKHRTPTSSVKCGCAQLRRITAGHNISNVAFDGAEMLDDKTSTP